MANIFTVTLFIERSKIIHGNKYQYSKTDYKLARLKVCITCPKHGDFYQTPNSHLSGAGCPKCAAEATSKRRLNRIIVNCIVCGKEISKNKYWAERSNRHLCSPECWSKWAKDSGIFRGENSATWRGALQIVTCTTCGKAFQRYKSDHKDAKNIFCSKGCWNKYITTNPAAKETYPLKFGIGVRGGNVVVKCHTCGQEFNKERNQSQKRKFSFCSRKCWAVWRSSDEWRKENSPTYKPEMPDEERYWRSHIEPTLNVWIKKVKARDNFTCQVCGIKQKRMIAHHLNSWNSAHELRIDINNGICLCYKCHDEFHTTYKKGNNTADQFQEFTANWKQEHALQQTI